LGNNFDLLLGQSWLLRHKAILNYGTMTVTLFKGEKRHVIRLEKPPKKGPTKPRPLSAKKFIAASSRDRQNAGVPCQGGVRGFGYRTGHPHVSTIRTEFGDVIRTDLPDDLPPPRKTHEVIPQDTWH
jgi:hypothetical protein